MATKRILVFLSLFYFINCYDNRVQISKECKGDICEFDWEIDYVKTMVYYNKTVDMGDPVVAKDGKLMKRLTLEACDKYVPLTAKELDEVITADGDYKLAYAINGQIPGPPIVVYEDQTVVVTVKNKLLREAITIHWHGIVQRGTPWMDGVSMISQCPITGGQTFQYRFKASPAGTHWYHAHHGTMRTDGLAGALIVLPRPYTVPETEKQRLPSFDEDFIAVVQDWNTNSSISLLNQLRWRLFLVPYGYNVNKCYNFGRYPDNVDMATVYFNAGLVNGKGRRYIHGTDTAEIPDIPLEFFHVQRFRYYRFRFIHVGSEYAFMIHIPKHEIGVISMTGNDVEKYMVEAVVILPGESVDIMIYTGAPIDSYWIILETLEGRNVAPMVSKPDKGTAILRYKGALSVEPQFIPQMTCTRKKPCRILNCPFGAFPKRSHMLCIPSYYLKSTKHGVKQNPISLATTTKPIETLFFNIHYHAAGNGDIEPRPAINGKRFVTPSSPLQLYPTQEDAIMACDPKKCIGQCLCTHIVRLDLGKTYQIVLFNNESNLFRLNHPIHIHGNHFHLLKTVYPIYEPKTGKYKASHEDITCSLPLCKDASWTDPTWTSDNIPGLNLVNPPVLETVNVPFGGYTIIRLKADSPGFWMFHCHLEPHQALGMAAVFQVGEINDMSPKPEGIPTCGNFRWTNREFEILRRP